MRQKEWEFGGSVSDTVIGKQEGYLRVLPKSCEEEKFFEKKGHFPRHKGIWRIS